MVLGCSYPIGKKEIKKWIFSHFPENSRILDLGCGGGTYPDLLADKHYIFDGVDIYEPTLEYIVDKYDALYCMNIMDFPFLHDYDLVIMGDVLEHLSVSDAQTIIPKILQHCKYLLVAIPFDYAQGPIEDNAYEEHLQADLNFQTMKERYPELDVLLYIESDKYVCYLNTNIPYLLRYGYYIAKGALYNE